MRAIVLSRRDFRENDQMIVLYTEEKGRVEALARGVKKIVSKNTAHLEPFFFVDAEIIPGKEIMHLTHVQPLNGFKNVRINLKKSLFAGYVVSVTELMISRAEGDLRIFYLLKSWLEFLDKVEDASNNLTYAYLVKLMHLLGFRPSLDYCSVCNNPAQDDQLGFQMESGGVICANCLPRVLEAKTIKSEELDYFRLLLNEHWEMVNELKGSKNVHTLIYEFVLYHTERKLPRLTWEERLG